MLLGNGPESGFRRREAGMGVSDKALRKAVAKRRLLLMVTQVLQEDPEFLGARMDTLESDHATGEVATVVLPGGNVLQICLLKHVTSTDVIRRGILAMDRMAHPDARWQHALLVMPGLDIEQPMFMGKGVAICSLEFAMVRAAMCASLSQHA